MKGTKEDKVFEIESNKEMKVFKSIATGRKFFKAGEGVIDICNQEIERDRYEHSNFLIKLFKRLKFKNRKEKYMLETRNSNVIRAVAFEILRNSEENEKLNLDGIILTKKVRKYILAVVEKYEEENLNNKQETNKVIDIKAKGEKKVS